MARPTPNFIVLEESLRDVGRSVAAIEARQAVESRSWSASAGADDREWWADVLADSRARTASGLTIISNTGRPDNCPINSIERRDAFRSRRPSSSMPRIASGLIERSIAIEQSSNARRELRLSDGLLEKINAFVQPAMMNDRISGVTGHI